jgi:hypothetical protein
MFTYPQRVLGFEATLSALFDDAVRVNLQEVRALTLTLRLRNLVKLTERVVIKFPTGIAVVVQQLTLFAGWIESEPVGAVHPLVGRF